MLFYTGLVRRGPDDSEGGMTMNAEEIIRFIHLSLIHISEPTRP